MYIKGKVTLNFQSNANEEQDREEMLSIACKVHKGVLVILGILFTLKNNEQQVRAPANVYLFNQTFNSFT